MRRIKIFDLNVAELILRFYLMVGVVALSGFLGQMTIAAILGYALAISCILGISFRKIPKKAATKAEGKLHKKVQEGTIMEAA